MDLNKKLRKTLKRKILLKNDMNVFTDSEPEEDESVISSIVSVSTKSELDIVLHHEPFRLANSMSVSSSDSDSDFVQVPFKQKIIKVKDETSRKKRQSPQKAKNKNLSTQSQSTSKKNFNASKTEKMVPKISAEKLANTSEKKLQSATKNTLSQSSPEKNLNVGNSKTTSPNINVISVERVNIALNSITPETPKLNTVQGKQLIARNIFAPSSSTSIKNKSLTTIGIQTTSENQESDESEKSVSGSTDNKPRNVEMQADININNSTNGNVISPFKVNLKRPCNVTTQTDFPDFPLEISSDGKTKQPVKQKTVQIQVTPPKRLKTIEEGCSLDFSEDCAVLRLIDEHQKKLEAAKVNLTKLLNNTPSSSNKTPSKCEMTPVEKQSSAVENRGPTTPMKQTTITDLNFFKSRNTQSANTTPNVSPAKSTSSISPVKSAINTSPEKIDKSKKENRYTKESHNRVFENVKKIVNWVLENTHFNILFTKSEVDLLNKLFDLPDQRLTVLCLRLFTRQHKWYNLPNLCEELNLTYEGFNLKEFYSTLNSGFVSSDYSEEKIEVLMDYLPLPAIKNICRDFRIKTFGKKQFMINKLLEYSNNQCTLTSLKRADQVLRDRVEKKLGICVKLETKVKDILFRVHLLYSITNPDLETANDIYNLMYKIQNELIIHPKVKIDSPNLFSDRQDFLKFAEACILRNEFYEQIKKKDIPNEHLLCVEGYNRLKNLLSNKKQIAYDKKKPLYLRRFSTAWVYCKVLTAGSQNLGKQHPDDVCTWLSEMLKQEVYCTQSRGKWYSQLALVTRAHKKDISGEAQTIEAGLSDKYVKEVQMHDLSIRGSKIKKAKLSPLQYDKLQCLLLPEIDVPVSRTIQANVVHNNEPGRKLVFVRTTAEGKEYDSVEQTAINYYTEQDYTHGTHCEGQILDALFIILFWDIIYEMHVQNTFITEIQDRPLDLYSGEFYSNRKIKIEERLQNICDVWSLNKICQFACKIYTKHSMELKSLSSFDFVKEDTIPIIIKCIGQKLLAAIMERFAKDFKQFHSGLPDLFLWNSEHLTCCFVEVKSENDKLSTKQLLWINYLHKFGAKVEVCHVQHIGSSSIKKMKKKPNE